MGWYRSTDAAVRSKGTMYLVFHRHATHAWGRWVGMSDDGAVITRLGLPRAHTGALRPDRPGPHRRGRGTMTELRSRVAQFVIDVGDLDEGVAFWSAVLDATEEPLAPESMPIYRRLKLPDSDIRILLQRTNDPKTSPKERMHLDLETNDVEAEVQRIEALGATRWDHQQERGHDFWVLRDPWGNEFCVLPPEFPSLLSRRHPVTVSR